MVEVRLRAVRVDLQSNTPVLLLQESEGLGRTLPIFIGAPEATAIAFALQGMDTPRPMTHDLIRDLLEALDADVARVVVTELRSSTYYAEIVLVRDGDEVPVSSRPSDAVAVAVRTGAPLFVADDLMDAEGIMLAVDEEDEEDEESEGAPAVAEGNPEEIVGEFRSFLDSIRPEDFSS
jgi:bifunctional DNase/RNase